MAKKAAKKAASKATAKKKAAKKSAAKKKPDPAVGMPPVGSEAPAFTAEAVGGGLANSTVSLADYRGQKNVVLYFYPRDLTPGCTTEACDFRDAIGRLQSSEAVVLGVSPDDRASHEKFIAKHDLSFPLLSDPDSAVCRAYGTWVEKSMYGKTYMGVQRATFLIDRTGRIAAVWPKVKVAGHVDAVLAAIDALD